MILRAGQELLGTTTGRRHPGDKETWWWNVEVKDEIRAKKEANKRWEAQGGRKRDTSKGKQTRRQRKK